MFPPPAQTVRPACCSVQSPTTTRDRVERDVCGLPAAVTGPDGEAVVGPRHHDQPAARGTERGQLGRGGERVPRPLHHQRRQTDGGQLAGPRALGTTGRVQRERERQHADGAHLLGGAAGDPGAGAAPTDHHRVARTQVVGHRAEAHVEHRRCGRHPLAGDPPRLLDEHDRDAASGQQLGQPLQVHCPHSPAGAVPEQQGGHRQRGLVAVHASRPVRRLDGGQPRLHRTAQSSSTGSGSTSCGPLFCTELTSRDTG